MSESSVVSLSRFQAQVSRSLTRRGQRLMESGQLATQIPALEPWEAYLVVKEIGVGDAGPILKHTSPEQFQAFVDLDCWRGDHIEALEIDAWLAPYAELGPETLVRFFLQLDEELQVLFLGQTLQIYESKDEDAIPPAPKSVVRKTTPDGYFVVQSAVTDHEIDPLLLVDALYRHDINRSFSLLTSARWETKSPLEEEAYRFRRGRLEDLGLPPREVALKLLTPVREELQPRAERTVIDAESRPLPALYAGPLQDETLLGRALTRVTDERILAELSEGLILLVNSALVAFDRSPQDLKGVTDLVAAVRDILCLGLEVRISPLGPLEFPEGEAAAQAAANQLQTYALPDLFRIGYQALAGLGQAVEAWAQDPVVAEWLNRDDDGSSPNDDDRDFVAALRKRPPQRETKDVGSGTIGSQRELKAAEQRLEKIKSRVG